MLAHTFAFCVRFWLVSKSMSQCTLTGGAGRPINSVMRQTQAALIIAVFFFKLELISLEGDGKGLFHEFQYIPFRQDLGKHGCSHFISFLPQDQQLISWLL
jgi:hypothetical protein